MTLVASQTVVEIAGTDVSSYVNNWLATERLKSLVDVAEVFLSKSVGDVLTINNEATVVIKRGPSTGSENVIFRGFVKVKNNNEDGVNIVLNCEGKIGQAERRQVTNTYDKNNDPQAGVLSAILEDVMETYAGLQFTVTDSSSYSSAIDIYPCNRDSCLERADELREVLDWVIRWDYDADIGLFQPKGYTQHPTVFRHNSAGGTNVFNTPVWEKDSATMVNEVEVIGKSQEEWHTQSFTATASQTVFTLESTQGEVEVTVDGTKKVLGVVGSTDTYDYTSQPHLKTITFESAMAGGEAVVVNYTRVKPVAVTLQDADSISVYSPTDPVTGEKLPFQRTFKFEDVLTVADAEIRAEEILTHFKDPLLNTIIEIGHDETTVRAGMKVRMVDSVEGVDDFFIVTEVVHQWPDMFDIVNIGQERVFEKTTQRAIDNRLRKLERRELANIDQITLRRDITKDVRFFGHLLIYRRDTSLDGEWGRGFSDGSTSNTMVWGETGALWQADWNGSNELYSVVWSENFSEEDFSDSTLIDTATMTGTLDTANATVTLSAGQNAIFGPCHLRVGGDQSSPSNISSVRIYLNPSALTGSINTVEVKSSAGGSWETVSGDITSGVGVNHTFLTPGIGVYLRLTSTAGATIDAKYSNGKLASVLFTEAFV